MRQVTRALGAALGVLLLGSLIMLIPQKNASGQQGNTQPVFVTNKTVPTTVTNTPLPISGNVNASQSGAWSVGVNNFPTTQSVSFSGAQPVSLTNTASAPLFIRDVDNAGRNPFAVSTGCSTATGGCPANVILPSNTANHGLVQTVVIEFVTVLCSGMTSGITQFNFNFNYILNGQQQAAFFPAAVDPFGVGRMAQLTALYADPGQTASFGPPGPASGCFVTLSGHLIPQ